MTSAIRGFVAALMLLATSFTTRVEAAACDSWPPRVTMFSTSWCPHCRSARDFFDAHEIPFVEFDIETVWGAREKLEELNGNATVPAIFVCSFKTIGFDEEVLRDMLGLP